MKKIYIYGAIVLAIIAAYWVAFGNPFLKLFGASFSDTSGGESKTSGGTNSEINNSNGSFISAPIMQKDTYGFPLSQGSTGTYVAKMQQALNDRFGTELVVDGIFGSKTAKALSANGFNPSAIYWKHYYEILGIKI